MVEIIFLDANIFLEVFLSNQKSEECKNLLNKIHQGDFTAYTSDFIMYSCLLQVQYKTKRLEIMKRFLLSLYNLSSLTILRLNFLEINYAFGIMEKYHLDFDDALVVSSMVKHNIKTLVSFDKDFNNVTPVKRVEPSQILLL